jgi:hypothetical protein
MPTVSTNPEHRIHLLRRTVEFSSSKASVISMEKSMGSIQRRLLTPRFIYFTKKRRRDSIVAITDFLKNFLRVYNGGKKGFDIPYIGVKIQ